MSDDWQTNPYYQVNTYLDWVKTEGVPIVEAYAVDWPAARAATCSLHWQTSRMRDIVYPRITAMA
ncbi:MAG: hypothetical protein NVSMB2_12060 [Chloroflexota bacterium]